MSDKRQLMPAAMPAALLGILAFVPAAGAGDFALEATAGYGHTDNITLVAADEQDEDIASLGAKFSFDQAGARTKADLVGDFAYYDYQNNTYGSELVGNFTGDASIGILPGRVEWVFADNFGQVLGDPFQPVTPDNRENLNYFTTGPELQFALGSQMQLGFGARYSLATYEDSPFDSSSLRGELELTRKTGESTSLGVHLRTESTEYDERLLNADYDQSEAFLRYDAQGARTHIGVDLGYTQVDPDAAAESQDDWLLRLDVSRQISTMSTLSLRAGHEFTNASSSFANQAASGQVGLEAMEGRQTVAPFSSDYATLTWVLGGRRTNLALQGTWRDESYEDRPALDQTLTSLGGSFSRTITPTTSISLDLTWTEGDFAQPNGDYSELLGGLALRWRMSRATSLNLTFYRTDRNSDLTGGGYTENRVFLSFGYGRGVPRDALQDSQTGSGPEQ